MHFRTYDHYPTFDNDLTHLTNICFICLDDQLDDPLHNIIQPMKYYTYRLALCDCNMYVHSVCLHKWHLYKNECPLCRKRSSLILFKPSVTENVFVVLFCVFKVMSLAYYLYVAIAIATWLHVIIKLII